jgi:tRNA threonylcarbamoyladenosine biosynthesis protein TsaB
VSEESGVPLGTIDAVAVSQGPGSYTGLRIGVSAAKGLCYALDKPLIAVDTLKAIALLAKQEPEIARLDTEHLFLCPMIDARRMEVYCAVFDWELNEVVPTDAVIVSADSFRFPGKNVACTGNGADKCRSVLSGRSDVLFPADIRASARTIALLAEDHFKKGEFVNTAYFEPYYLKDFIAGKPHVKGLHG